MHDSSLGLLRISLAASAFLALGGCDFYVSSASRMEKAAHLRTQGEYRAAAIQLKKVLQSNPENREARVLLGEISLLVGEPAGAEKEFRRAQELGVPRDNIIVPLGRAILAQGELDRALKEINPKGVIDDEIRVGVLMLRGDAYLSLGRLNDAERAFREVLTLRADSLDARIGLASVEQGKGNLGVAEAYIVDALSKNPAYVRGWLASGHLELRRGEHAQAASAFTRALELAPLSVEEEFIAGNGLAESQWHQGRSAEALQSVQRILALGVSHPWPKYFRAVIAYGAGDYETAKHYLQEVVRDFPTYQPAVMLLGATHFAEGDLEQAGMYLSSALTTDPSSVQTRKLLAATRLRQHKPREAMAVLTPAIAQDSNDSQLLALMGKASLDAGNTDIGILYLERGARSDPENRVLQKELAAGYATAGDLGRAIDLLEQMPETEHDDYEREGLLIMTRLRKGESQSALSQVRELIDRRPNDPAAHNLAGSAYHALGELSRAREHFERALQLEPNDPVTLMNLARLDLQEGEQDGARVRFEQMLAVNPSDLDAALALAQLAGLRGDQAGARQWLERAVNANPGAIEPRLLLVRHDLEVGDLDRAREGAAELARAEPDNADAQNALGVVQMADRRYEDAIASFRRAVAAVPTSPNFTYNLARAQMMREDFTDAKRLLARTLELQPDNVQAVSTLAVIEMREGNAKQALLRAHALQQDQDRDTAAAGYLLAGDLSMMQGKFDRAAQAYDAASRQHQNGVLAIRSYRARKLAGMADPARPLEDWLRRKPDDVSVRLALAQRYQEDGRVQEAAAAYEAVLDVYPDEAVALNNLAWIFYEAKDPRAVHLAERAHKLQPDAGAITDTLGWLLVHAGQRQRGIELLRNAARQAPDVPDIRYHLAVALAKTGAVEEAHRILVELLDSGQPFKEIAQAEQLLREL